MTGWKIISAAALCACLCAAGVPAMTHAVCTTQEYMEKVQRVQYRMMELQSKDPAKLQRCMDKMRDIGEDMKPIDESNAMSPESLDHMCKKVDEMFEAMK